MTFLAQSLIASSLFPDGVTIEGTKAEASSGDATLTDWLEELRAPFLTASVIPVLVGGAVAWAALKDLWGMDWYLFFLTMIGVVFLHLGANVTNDYWDFLGGTDVINRNRTAFSGGSSTLVDKRLSPRKVLRLGQTFLALGSIVGLYLVYLLGEDGWIILLLGMIGVGGAYFYSAPPISLASKGMGDLVIGALFGLLVVLGTYYIQVRSFSWEALAASIPVSLWIAAVIWVNQFPDMEADEASGKRTLVVRWGAERSIEVYTTLQVGAMAVIVGAVIMNLMPLAALVTIAAFVPAAGAIAVLNRSRGIYPDMEPAMGLTVITHLIGGTLLCVGIVVGA